MEKLKIKSVNEKIDELYDPEFVEEKRKEHEKYVIKQINKLMDKNSIDKELGFIVNDALYHTYPYREFYQEIKKVLKPYGYVCFFSDPDGMFYVSIPSSKKHYDPPSNAPRIELKVVDWCKKYHRKLSRACHPDQNVAPWATHAMKYINEARDRNDVDTLKKYWEYYDIHKSFECYTFQ
jgi:hypothetical protein